MEDLFLEKEDYTYLTWNKIRSSSGTAGSFLKSTENLTDRKIYYKLSNYDSMRGIVGHECVNELIVSRLLNALNIPHLEYRLIHGEVLVEGKVYDTFFCSSDSFRKKGERKITFEDYYQMQREHDESPLDFARRLNWQDKVYQMLLIDFLILNRDRHGANIEVIMDGNGGVRMAPLFDQGLSLLFGCTTDEEINKYDVMEDKPVQNYFGGKSAKENLKLISPKVNLCSRKLTEGDKDYIIQGLNEVLSEVHLDKIWEMIWKRWKYYEGLFDIQ